jgi:lambda repressor-like predicted transcriptional regulator
VALPPPLNKRGHVDVDSLAIHHAIESTGLPMWFIAEQSGISLATLKRWKNGHINKADPSRYNNFWCVVRQHAELERAVAETWPKWERFVARNVNGKQ